MKTVLISVVSSWLCATGVAVVLSYNTSFNCSDAQCAEDEAAKISRSGTILDYKPSTRHSSAIRKTTTAKASDKDSADCSKNKDSSSDKKVPTYLANPIYPAFTDALNRLTEELVDMAEDGEVSLENGLSLTTKDGKPLLKLPEVYTKVAIGGVAMGDELAGGGFSVCLKTAEGSDGKKIDKIVRESVRKRLDEPEFYCTDVVYSVLPTPQQVSAIRMHGNLDIGNTSRAYEMVDEIAQWMNEDYGAVDLHATVPAGTLAMKKLKIGAKMEVVVTVNWNRERTVEKGDANIDIVFTSGELEEENQFQCQELGQATDAARVQTLVETGVNYYTISPTVNADAVAKKVVY